MWVLLEPTKYHGHKSEIGHISFNAQEFIQGLKNRNKIIIAQSIIKVLYLVLFGCVFVVHFIHK